MSDVEKGVATNRDFGNDAASKDLDGTNPVVGSISTTQTVAAEGDFLIVEFEENDPRAPTNFSYVKKWSITLISVLFTAVVSLSSSDYSFGYDTMIPELQCTQMQATLGLSMFTLGFAVIPLVSSPFSEEVGRKPVYIVSATGFVLSQVMIALYVDLPPNVAVVIVGRFLNGAFGSTGAILVGGTIADIWEPAQRGLPMSIYSLIALFVTAAGPIFAGWVDMNKHMQWRWIAWLNGIFGGAYVLLALLITTETRASIILSRIAKQKRKETGDQRYRSRAELDSPGFWTLVRISCTRPLYLLFTEPVVFFFSLWIGFAWAILYVMIDSIGSLFSSVYGFSIGDSGSVFTALCIGSLFGCALNYYQETIYRREFATRGPEARLYVSLGAAILFPIGMYIYAWTAFPHITWVAPCVGLAVFMCATYVIYQTVFVYLADCYGKWASSALAGQSLFRNIMGMIFPLFTTQMYNNLQYKYANTLFAAIATLMIPIPYVLFFYGSRIRAKSKTSQKITADEAKK